MKALFICTNCSQDTVHIVVSSKIINSNYHIKLKCEICDTPPVTWVTEKTCVKGTMIHKSLNKNTS
jgi:hypothetical protein